MNYVNCFTWSSNTREHKLSGTLLEYIDHTKGENLTPDYIIRVLNFIDTARDKL